MEHLIELNPDKRVVVFLDNAPTHTSLKMNEFYQSHKESLELIYLPRYSPYMNPQENIWHYLKSKLFQPNARKSIDELVSNVKDIFSELNFSVHKICSLAYARSFLV